MNEKSKDEPTIEDEPGIAERFPARSTEGAQYPAETPKRTDHEGERAARIKGARSQGEDAQLKVEYGNS